MKNRYYRFDTAIYFIDFHRFPLPIEKNHLIAIDFYRYRFLSIYYSGKRVMSILRSINYLCKTSSLLHQVETRKTISLSQKVETR